MSKYLYAILLLLAIQLRVIAEVNLNSSAVHRVSNKQEATLMMATIEPDANSILYVNKQVIGGDGTGSSWANAIPELADALKWAKQNESMWETKPLQIWVAAGTYFPKYRPDDLSFVDNKHQYNSFLLVKNVEIYGGFASGDGSIAARDIATNRTYISGDFNSDDIRTGTGKTLRLSNRSDNAKVLFIAMNVSGSRIDGFTLNGGDSEAMYFGNMTVNGIFLSGYFGGAIYSMYGIVGIANCDFTENRGKMGAALYGTLSIIRMNNVRVYNNYASTGVVTNRDSKLYLWNSLFDGNYATTHGAGVNGESPNSITKIVNSTFVKNFSGGGSYDVGVSSTNTTVDVENSIILNTPEYYYSGAHGTINMRNSLVQGYSSTADGNIDASTVTETQVFTDYANGDYSLKYTGPAFNRGDRELYNTAFGDPLLQTDLAGNTRQIDKQIDLGAFESTTVTLPLTVNLVTDSGISNTDNITKVNSPTLSGTTVAGANVSIYAGSTLVGTVVSVDGNWSYTMTTTLPDGTYSIHVQGTHPDYISFPSDPILVTIDTQSPTISGVANGQTYQVGRAIAFNEGVGTLNGAPFLSGNTIVSSGTYSIEVVDLAGNTSSLTFSILKSTITPSSAKIIYVNKHVVGGTGTGDSWANATSELAEALLYAKQNKENFTNSTRLDIWVAAGNYKPMYTPADSLFEVSQGRLNSFLMVDYVNVYGGFAGSETDVNQRNWYTNKTILDGDLLGNDQTNLSRQDLLLHVTRADNAYHVVTYVNNQGGTAKKGSILDGFVITNGNAETFEYPDSFSSVPLIVNGFEVSHFQGGAIYVQKSYARINNIIFTKNSAYYGGAIANTLGSLGGVMNIHEATITNSFFEGNHGHYSGSAIGAETEKVIVVNCTFVNHTFGSGYLGSLIESGAAYITNSIALDRNIRTLNNTAYFNPSDYSTVYNSMVHGNLKSNQNGNIDASTLIPTDVFVDPAAGNYQLKAGSVAINAGNTLKYREVGTLQDLMGNTRVQGGSIDIGAFEFAESCPVITAPIASATQTFCDTYPYKKVSDLVVSVPAGAKKVWYSSATGFDLVDSTSILQNNRTYYVLSDLNGCESTERTAITVVLVGGASQPTTVKNITYVLNSTAVPLTATADANHTLKWHDDDWNETITAPTPSTNVVGSYWYGVKQVHESGCEGYYTDINVRVVPSMVTPDANGIVYVNQNVNGGNASGDSWQNAIASLGDALEFAVGGTAIKQVWVAKGTYYPTYTGYGTYEDETTDNTFNITNLKVYGGFNGTETTLNQRDWHINKTILSGNIGDLLDMTDNVQNILTSTEAEFETVLDGFIVEKANGGYAAMVAYYSDAPHIVNHCIFRDNTETGSISAEYLDDFVVANSQFVNNSGVYAGGIYSYCDNAIITACIFYNNQATRVAGAIENYRNMDIKNSIFWNNTLNGLTNVSGSDIAPTDYDSDTYAPSISHSIVQFFTPTTSPSSRTASTLINQDPLFENVGAGDFRLRTGSPGIDAGDNTGYDAALLGTRDLAGVDRIRNSSIDLGSYETQEGNNPLPLRLISFTGVYEGNTVVLNWRTAEEENTRNFQIEHSTDGREFRRIGTTAAMVSGNHSYRFVDHNPVFGGANYYRLRMEDIDGSYSYSRIISLISKEQAGENSMKVYPNPVVSNGITTFEVLAPTTAAIYNTVGRIVAIYTLVTGKNELQLPQLVAGMYVIVTQSGQTARIVVVE